MNQQLFPASAFSYDEARAVLNALLEQCVRKLNPADMRLAYERLDVLEKDGVVEWVVDAAFYSYRGRRRAIDRILPKVKVNDELAMRLKEGLSTALFSVFEVLRIDSDNRVQLKDLLEDCRELTMIDHACARTARPGLVFAARLVDAGPWYMGLGIIEVLNKSEAVALGLLLGKDGQEDLHELVYRCGLHDIDLVTAVAMPVLDMLCEEFDQSPQSAADLLQSLRGPAGKLASWPSFDCPDPGS